jgi:hypothetical protein
MIVVAKTKKKDTFLRDQIARGARLSYPKRERDTMLITDQILNDERKRRRPFDCL